MESGKSIFSFYDGFLSLFGLNERRLERIRKAINSRSDAEAITGDFNKVGKDIRSSMKKIDTKKELPELYICD